MKNWYEINIEEKDIKKERDIARKLKKTSWWQEKLNKGICYYCGEKFTKDKLTMDHIVPIARGGKSTKSNIVASCKNCNKNKGLDTCVDKILERNKK